MVGDRVRLAGGPHADRKFAQARGIEALRRARAGFEVLVQDHPAYTLPTAADGPTEYRRSLAQVHYRIAYTLADLGDFAGALSAYREQKEVVAALTAGPFATDTDRRNLADSNRGIGRMLNQFGLYSEAIRLQRRALASARQLAVSNPMSAEYRADLCRGLQSLANTYSFSGDNGSARRFALEAIATLQSLPTVQRDRYELVRIEANSGWTLSTCAMAAGRPAEALRYARHSLALCEQAGRAHPDSPNFVGSFVCGVTAIGGPRGIGRRPHHGGDAGREASRRGRGTGTSRPPGTF